MTQENRIVASEAVFSEKKVELSGRPVNFIEFYGQKKIISKLKVFIQATLIREEVLDHVLLSGPPGLGKTTLANIVAAELGVSIRVITGPSLDRPGDLASILTNLTKGEVLFIDEIHRLNIAVEEMLYSVMEDFRLDIIIGKGPSARTVSLSIPQFTLIGATTMSGKVSKPLRNRFGVPLRLEYYSDDEIVQILEAAAIKLGFSLNSNAAARLGTCSRGTPRIAIRLLRRIRDFASIKKTTVIDLEIVETGLKALEIDSIGLDSLDRKIMSTMINDFDGGPVSLDTIAAMIGEDSETIYEVYEPFLIMHSFIRRTPRGRIVTPKTYKHLGYKLKEKTVKKNTKQSELFKE